MVKGRVGRSQKEIGSIPGKENRTRKGIEIKKNILSTFKAYDTIQINPTYLASHNSSLSIKRPLRPPLCSDTLHMIVTY